MIVKHVSLCLYLSHSFVWLGTGGCMCLSAVLLKCTGCRACFWSGSPARCISWLLSVFIDCHTCWLSLFHTISAVCLCALQECSGFTGVLHSMWLTNSPLCSPLTLMSLWDFILKSQHFAHCSLRPAQQRALTGAAKQQWNSLTPHRKNLLFFSNFHLILSHHLPLSVLHALPSV